VSLPGPKGAAAALALPAPAPETPAPAPVTPEPAPPKKQEAPKQQVKTTKKTTPTKPAPPEKEKKKKPEPKGKREESVPQDARTGGFKGKIETPAAPATALPGGGAASIGIDATDFTFSYYLVTIQNAIAREWSAPAGLTPGTPLLAVVYFQIERDGRIVRPTVETGSGVALYDKLALRAVERAKLPPLPAEFAGGTLGVHFQFEYAP
jgi:TonB family protein